MSLSIIAAVGKNGEIGINNKIPWKIPEDLKRFKEITEGHTVIMGRKTFESIGKPLPNRKNIVISQNITNIEGIILVNSLSKAINLSINDGEVFVIGGAKIYEALLPFVEKMYITTVDKGFEADTYFPEINEKEWKITQVSFGHRAETESAYFSYLTYERKRE